MHSGNRIVPTFKEPILTEQEVSVLSWGSKEPVQTEEEGQSPHEQPKDGSPQE